MKLSVALAALAMAFATSAVASERPNIVLIVADDLGVGDVSSYYPQGKINTPNIDALAAEGTRFTDGHVPASVCTPTRYGLMTGRYAWRTRLKKEVLWSWANPLIEQSETTLPEMLQSVGYDTAMIGKWHLGWKWPTTDGKAPVGQGVEPPVAGSGSNVDFARPTTDGPHTHGFQWSYASDGRSFPPYTWLENGAVVNQPTVFRADLSRPGMAEPGWEPSEISATVRDKAVEYIAGRVGNPTPFFLYLPLTSPHLRIDPRQPWQGTSLAGPYGDYVQQTDSEVGDILAALEPIKSSTLVIFMSDNGGWGAAATGLAPTTLQTQYGHRTNGPYRYRKGSVYEGGLRVPFIVRWPGRVPVTVSSAHVVAIDWMRTLGVLTGATIPADAAPDSFDMGPELWGGERVGPKRWRTVYHSLNGTFVLRQNNWKLIAGSGTGDRSDTTNTADALQLYNMSTDPAEASNVAGTYPTVASDLHIILNAIKSQARTYPAD